MFMCIWGRFTLCLLQIAFYVVKCPQLAAVCQTSLMNEYDDDDDVLVFTRSHDFAQYSASILKVCWEWFPTLNVAKCEATVAKVS